MSATFTPMQGFLALLDRAAAAIRLPGWDGENGLREVARRKLADVGVPQNPIAIGGQAKINPVSCAEDLGFIRKQRRKRKGLK